MVEMAPNSTPMATIPSRSTHTTDPFPVGMQRLAALSGILFVVLLIASIVVNGSEPPDFNDPVQQWTKFAADHQDDARIGALIFGFAAFEFMWFLGYLRGTLGSAELEARGFTRLVHIAYAGGIVGIAGMILGMYLSGVGLSHEDASPDVIRMSNDLSGAAFVGLGSVGMAVLTTAAGILIVRTRVFAAWIGWLGLACGVFFLLQLLNLLSEDADNAFTVFFPLAFLAFLVWVIACSVTFLRRLRPAAVAAEPVAPPPAV
jgi:hypothetical protein